MLYHEVYSFFHVCLKGTMRTVCIADFPCNYNVNFFSCFAAGVVIEEKNWPPFFPLIHHDIANEIPIHLQRVQYVAFTTYLGMLAKYPISWQLYPVFQCSYNTRLHISYISHFSM